MNNFLTDTSPCRLTYVTVSFNQDSPGTLIFSLVKAVRQCFQSISVPLLTLEQRMNTKEFGMDVRVSVDRRKENFD